MLSPKTMFVISATNSTQNDNLGSSTQCFKIRIMFENTKNKKELW